MSRAEVDALWEMSLTKLKVTLTEQFSSLRTPKDLMQVKYTCVLLARVMEGYGFEIQPLMEFLRSTREQFEALLFARLREDIKEIFEAEKYEPLGIANAEEYENFVLAFNLQDPSINVE